MGDQSGEKGVKNQAIVDDIGTGKVDKSITPQVDTSKTIYHSASQLPSNTVTDIYFNGHNINLNVQTPNRIAVNTSNTIVSNYIANIKTGSGIWDDITWTWSKVIGSTNNVIHIDQNHINFKISGYAVNTSAGFLNQLSLGDHIYWNYLSCLPGGIDRNLANATFFGIVEYIDTSNSIITVTPIHGSPYPSNSKTVIYNSDKKKTLLANVSSVVGHASVNTSRVTITRTFGWDAADTWHGGNFSILDNDILSHQHNEGIRLVNRQTVESNISIGTHGFGMIASSGHLNYLTPIWGWDRIANVVATISGANTSMQNVIDKYIGTSITVLGDMGHPPQTANIVGVVPTNSIIDYATYPFWGSANSYSWVLDANLKAPVATGPNPVSGYSSSNTVYQWNYTGSCVRWNLYPSQVDDEGFHNLIITNKGGDNLILPAGNAHINISDPPIINVPPLGGHPQQYPPGTGSGQDPNPSKNILELNNLAQTFTTPPPKSLKQNYGIFVSSVVLYFAGKPDKANTGVPAHPVVLHINPTYHGYPTKDILGSATVQYKDIKVSPYPEVGNTVTETVFRFDDPVYLQANTEYAFTISSKSPDYTLYTAIIGNNALLNPAKTTTANSSVRKVSESPSVNHLFKSQNALLWTPEKNEDLMFVINKAQFTTNVNESIYFNARPMHYDVVHDSVVLASNDFGFPSATVTYKWGSKLINSDSLEIVTLDKHKQYNFGYDLKISNSGTTRSRIIPRGNSASVNVSVILNSTDPDVTPIFHDHGFHGYVYENVINYGDLSHENVTITNPGSMTYVDSANLSVSISDPDLSDGYSAVINVANCIVTYANGKYSLSKVVFDNYGSGYVNSPTITFSTSVGGDVPPTVVCSGENGKFGGNMFCRYVTKKVILADGFDSGDMRVYLHAVKPAGTQILVFYKVKSAADSSSFSSKSWKQMQVVTDFVSPDQVTTVDLEYRPNLQLNQLRYVENGVTYPIGGTFKEFAIKIVLMAKDPCVYPYVEHMRAIAIPAG